MNSKHYQLKHGAIGIVLLLASIMLLSQSVLAATVNEYTVTDSNAPDGPLYDWIDATDGGTLLTIDEDKVVPIELPFEFTFGAVSSTQLLVGNNGGIIFGTSDDSQTVSWDNKDLTDDTVMGMPDNLIVPFWDDLDEACVVHTKTVGSEVGHRRFVIEWSDCPCYEEQPPADRGTVAFELILYEGTNNIKFQYQDVMFENNAHNNGTSATVGLRGSSASDAVQYAYNQATLSDKLAICFKYPDPDSQYGCDAQPVEGLTFTQAPSGGRVNETYTFAIQAKPDTALQPVQYTWETTEQGESSGTTNTQSYKWTTNGTKTITVTATNDFGSEVSTHTIVISEYPVVHLGDIPPFVEEDAVTIAIPVVLDQPHNETVTVECLAGADDDTATAGADYTMLSSTATFTPGVTEGSCSVAIEDDNCHEDTEQFILKLGPPTPSEIQIGEPSTTRITIEDNDPEITIGFSQDEYTVRETSNTALITVKVDPPPPFYDNVIVQFSTEDDRAKDGIDYIGKHNYPVSFSANSTLGTVAVPLTILNSVPSVEGYKTVNLALSSPQPACTTKLATKEAVLKIHSVQEQPCTIRFDRELYKAAEKDGVAPVSIERIGDCDAVGPVSVDMITFDGTATNGRDYTRTEKKVSFSADTSIQTVDIPILDDDAIEGDETVILTLNNITNTHIKGSRQVSMLSIQDSDTPPEGTVQFTKDTYYVLESSGTVTITVNRAGGTKGSVEDVWVESDNESIDSQAEVDSDYQAVGGFVPSFADGVNEQTFELIILPDDIAEGDELFFLDISLTEDATGGPALGKQRRAKVVIIDDDYDKAPAGVIQLRPTYYVDEDNGEATIVVDRVGGHAGEVSVEYAAVDGTATEGIDYIRSVGEITFEDGETSKLFTVPIIDDTLPGEPNETVRLVLGNLDDEGTQQDQQWHATHVAHAFLSNDAATQGNNSAILYINDPSAKTNVDVQTEDVEIEFSEGNVDREVPISIKCDNCTDDEVTVEYYTQEGRKSDATEGEDYVYKEDSLTFDPSGTKTQTKEVSIMLKGDDVCEEDEKFSLVLENESGAELANDECTIIILDDDCATGDFPEAGFLTMTTPYVLQEFPAQQVLFVATILDEEGNPIKRREGVTVQIGGRQLPMYDCGQEGCEDEQSEDGNKKTGGDLEYGDGIYSAEFIVPTSSLGDIEAFLMVDGQPLARSNGSANRVELQIIDNPDLLVVTDWRQLYDEFRDTGMQVDENQAVAKDEDQQDVHNNHTHDFYDLIERINSYAANHRGVVVNLDSLGWYTEFAYSGGTEARRMKGQKVDQLIAMMQNQSNTTIKHIAIIGDDQVVPFYRVHDPTDYYGWKDCVDPSPDKQDLLIFPDKCSHERSYYMGASERNVAMEDLVTQAYLLSDVPYSTNGYYEDGMGRGIWKKNPPPGIVKPEPDMGIGRIFALRPLDLIQAIDMYEKPLVVNPKPPDGSASATVLIKDTKETFIDLQNRRSFFLELQHWFGDALNYLDPGTWNKTQVKDALSQKTVVYYWGHANHKGFNDVYATDIDEIALYSPVIFTGHACHLGLALSDYPDDEKKDAIHHLFKDALVNTMVKKGVTVFAPSSQSYGYDIENVTLAPNLHELMVELFVNNIDEQNISTVGELWQQLFPLYHSKDPILLNKYKDWAEKGFHTTGAYGMVLYGLPTQPITQKAEDTPSLCTKQVAQTQRSTMDVSTDAQTSAKDMSTTPIPIDVDLPHIEATELENDVTLFRVLNGGGYIAPANGAMLPMVVHSHILPEDTIVTGVRLVESVSHAYTQTVKNLPQTVVRTSNDETITSTYELPDIYPQQIYTYTVTPKDNGTFLMLKVIPMQYEQATGKVTLYDKLHFEVDTIKLRQDFLPSEDETDATLSSSNDAKLAAGVKHRITDFEVSVAEQQKVNENGKMTITFESSEAGIIPLDWVVNEPNGTSIIASGHEELNVNIGLNQFACTLDTTGWLPGKKTLNAFVPQQIKNEPRIAGSNNIELTALGMYHSEVSPTLHVSPQNLPFTWDVIFYNQDGQKVQRQNGTPSVRITIDPYATTTALAADGLLSGTLLDESSPNLTVTETDAGTYRIALILPDDVGVGDHWIRMNVTDAEGITSYQDTVIRASEPVTPPPTPTPTPTPTTPPCDPATEECVYLPLINR